MKRIFVIDDCPDQRELLRTVLTGAGYAVEEAVCGSECVRKEREHAGDLAIVDIFMPEMDGFETMTELRRIDPNIRLLAVSGGGTLRSFNWMGVALRLGADAVLEKPFGPTELLASVKGLVGAAGQ